MRTRTSLANALLIAGAVALLLALPALPVPATAAPRAALTETAEPTVVTATPSPVPTAFPSPTATQTAAPTATATAIPTAEGDGEPRRADPAVSKSGSTGEARVGDLVTFTVTVTNNGNADASDVVVEDSLPSFLELVSATTTRGDLQTTARGVRLFLGRVSPGDEVVMEIVTRAIGPAEAPNNRNTVSLRSANGGDNLSNNEDGAAVSVSGGSAALTPEAPTATPEAPTATPEAPTTTAEPVAVAAPAPALLPSTGAAARPGLSPALVLALALLAIGATLRWRR